MLHRRTRDADDLVRSLAMRSGARAYADANRWMKTLSARRAARGNPWLALNVALLGGVIVVGTIGLASPSAFGDPHATPARGGWPWFAVLALVVVCASPFALSGRNAVRIARPRAELADLDAVEAATNALRASAAAYRTRFALTWIWLPIVGAVAGVAFSLAAAYFAVDAILARFQVGLAHPLLAIVDVALAAVAFRAAGPRLTILSAALRVHRHASEDA